jgi:hypothetical protein
VNAAILIINIADSMRAIELFDMSRLPNRCK